MLHPWYISIFHFLKSAWIKADFDFFQIFREIARQKQKTTKTFVYAGFSFLRFQKPSFSIVLFLLFWYKNFLKKLFKYLLTYHSMSGIIVLTKEIPNKKGETK